MVETWVIVCCGWVLVAVTNTVEPWMLVYVAVAVCCGRVLVMKMVEPP